MNKNKIINILGYFFLILSLFGYYYLEKTYFTDFSVDRIITIICVILFLFFHFIFDINKMYSFIYKKRYWIGSILLLYIIVMGYHGSSVGMYNRFIQTNSIPNNSNPILGVVRGIRSDEWMVNTPYFLSQTFAGFSKYNNLFMGRISLVSLYPSIPNVSLALLGKLFYISFMFLPFNNAFAFYWFGKMFLLFFVTFELFMILTKKNKLYSLLGSILITLAPANMWWSSIDVLVWGNTATLIFYYFIKAKNKMLKILLTILLGIVGLNYILIVYPAWQVSFGYIYLGLFLYILLNNKKDLSFKLLYYLPIIVFTVVLPLYLIINESSNVFNLINNTVYPGSRLLLGGTGKDLLFNYIINPFYTFKDALNPSEYSNFIGFYPLPIMLSIYYLIKNKKNNKKSDLFLLIITIITIFISIWNYIELPKWFVKMFLLSYSTPFRSQIVVNFACIFLLTYILSIYQEKNVEIKKYIFSIIIAISLYIISIFILKTTMDFYITKKIIIASGLIFIPLFLLFILNCKKYNKYFAIMLILISLFAGGTVNPISKGFTAITNKPLSKAITSIINEDEDSKWATINTNIAVANFALANGAKIINSTNFYPNFELWERLDYNGNYKEIYNRYAHVVFEITKNSTSFELLQPDYFKVKINVNDICKLDINYAISDENMSIYNTNNIIFETIYDEDQIKINKVVCQ